MLEERNPTPQQLRSILSDRARFYEKEPPQDAAVARCVQAHRDLIGDRQQGPAGMGPVPFGAVKVWAEAEGYDREAARIIFDVLQYLDNERARLQAAKAALEAARGRDHR